VLRTPRQGGRIVRDQYLHPDDDARRGRIRAKLELIEHDTPGRQLKGGHRARRVARCLAAPRSVPCHGRDLCLTPRGASGRLAAYGNRWWR
jgi:hypothetical protein